MFGWLRATVVLASSTKRRTNSSSMASSSRICLTTSFFSKPPAPRKVARTTRAMPPMASSRSSTYLPKICGYIGAVRGLHSSKAAGVLALFAATAACKGQGDTLRSIRVNVVKACVPSPAATANLLPSGDFPRLAQSVPMPLDQMGARIDIPLDTRALLATLGPSLLGVTDVAAAGDVDLLMWPTETVCQLTTTVPFEPGEALGLVDAQ